ncbi:MAG: beta-ribofuranosylaminobenzene 5'-phosphate synthase [Pirellulaceae bacterium]
MTTSSDRVSQTVRIVTGSRLHFGLLDTAPPFGGVGVMIDHPQTEVIVTPSETFACDDPSSRTHDIANRLTEFLGLTNLPHCHVRVAQRATAHHGLGTGTQLALAVAEAMATFCGLDLPPEVLASKIASRGKRSAVGSHGYFRGGLIFESSDSDSANDLNAIQHRIELPNDWRVLIFRPTETSPTVSGTDEQDQFDRLGSASNSQQDELRQIVQKQLIPTAEQAEFGLFCEAVHRYNHQSGMLFSSVQGGPYSSPAITDLVSMLTSHGGTGVGQSSWGPSVFSWFESPSSADEFIHKVKAAGLHPIICQVQNEPRTRCVIQGDG